MMLIAAPACNALGQPALHTCAAQLDCSTTGAKLEEALASRCKEGLNSSCELARACKPSSRAVSKDGGFGGTWSRSLHAWGSVCEHCA